MNNIGHLYRLDFPNGKYYIGVTKETPEFRFRQHVKMSRRPDAKAVHLAIAKYGIQDIDVRTLAIGELDYLYELEIRAIKSFNTKSPNGYNLTDGGDRVSGLSEETRLKMGAKNKGKIATEETRNRMSKAFKLKPPPSAETRLKLSIAGKGKTLSQEHKDKIGAASRSRVVTEETKRKISESKKGKGISESNRLALIAANTGRVKTPQEIEKLRVAHTGRVFSEEHKNNIRISKLNRSRNDY